jgi:hypothetical protein
MEMASIINQYYDAFMIKYGDTVLLRIPAKTATYSGNNFTTYTFIQFPC